MKFEKCDNTNCYDNADEIIKLFTSFIDIYDLGRLHDIIKNNININKTFAYRIDILIKDGKRNVFNHSFVIIQHKYSFTICDSWEGVHRLECTDLSWSEFNKWFKNVRDSLHDIDNLHNLFLKDNTKEYEYLKSIGEYALKTSEFYKHDNKKDHKKDHKKLSTSIYVDIRFL